jgi:hypothetical protein
VTTAAMPRTLFYAFCDMYRCLLVLSHQSLPEHFTMQIISFDLSDRNLIPTFLIRAKQHGKQAWIDILV